MTILFLCSANMHRSPAAAAMLRHQAALDRRDDMMVLSAGIMASEGAGVVSEAAELAARQGLDLSGHRACQATAELLDRADFVLVMESAHRDWVARVAPRALPRCRLLSEFGPPGGELAAGDDVPDAIGEGPDAFARTWRILTSCVRGFHEQLPAVLQEVYASSVEQRLARLTGRAMPLTPADWQILDRWWRQAVPLWMVLDEIDALGTGRHPAGTRRRIRRLSACRAAVEARFEAHLRSMAPAPLSAPPAHAEGSAALRRAALRARAGGWNGVGELIDRVAGSLQEIEAAAGTIDQAAYRLRLMDLDRRLLAGLVEASDPVMVARCREEAADELHPLRARMHEAAWEKTVRALTCEKVRRAHEVPLLGG